MSKKISKVIPAIAIFPELEVNNKVCRTKKECSTSMQIKHKFSSVY